VDSHEQDEFARQAGAADGVAEISAHPARPFLANEGVQGKITVAPGETKEKESVGRNIPSVGVVDADGKGMQRQEGQGRGELGRAREKPRRSANPHGKAKIPEVDDCGVIDRAKATPADEIDWNM
jgi:hypothetical protein